MSNKIILQENNALLNEYIVRINEAKDTASLLPDTGGGASIATRDITIKTKNIKAIKNVPHKTFVFDEKKYPNAEIVDLR